ncbi:MAG: bifunctional NADP-dependent methylenetetrahydromethanopterin dehydrogenase/methylenetetrahydrofolate dehydrogenase [Planctomycetales bacterium 12-60-4]|nr:MAG: bifunctional NADP-dependent methylenetetrahydromethanopterin dehydrogenase/methylenetetrahydrofolate dehydrogenase [Planctomycetales bacterium 12-60-4]
MKRILFQIDTDPLPSTFDRVVAVDAGVDELFSYGGVNADNVESLVHGGMFTRKPSDLKNTAVFIGGSNVAAGEALLARVRKAFFGPVRLSVMMDSNGSNTTAAATVIAISRHLALPTVSALILGGTGPVGLRAAQILLGQGATVRLASRTLEKAQAACAMLGDHVDTTRLTPCESQTVDGLTAACEGVNVIVGAGAAGAELISAERWAAIPTLKVVADLNAVPPAGIGSVDMLDKAVERNGVICYGAIGVGGTKMKIHTAAVQQLFLSNDKVLDTAAIFEIARAIG